MPPHRTAAQVTAELTQRVAIQKLKERGKGHLLEALLAQKSKCVYQTSFIAFLYDCVWTIDEGRAGEVRAWPRGGEWDAYWLDIENAFLGVQGPLLVDKTRRTMISNVCTAFDLWILAGGQDPRWPALMFSTENRRVLIQSQKREGPGGSEEFLARIGTFYRLAVERGLRKKWPNFPTFEFNVRDAKGSNGSLVQAVAQGADQVRGPGTTLLRMEELSAWEQAQDSCEAAIPALNPYGHLIAPCTPKVGSYAARIREGEFKMYGAKDAIPETKKLPLIRAGDWTVLEIRGVRDVPGYNADDFRGMSVQKHRAEVLGDWTASGGKIVYPEYGDVHEPQGPLPFNPKEPLLCGWDLPAATGGTKAFVATQLSSVGQWCIYGSIQEGEEEKIGTYEFAERVYGWLYEKFAEPAGMRVEDLRITHYADPAGNQKALRGDAKEVRSAYEIIYGGEKYVGPDGELITKAGFGWVMHPGEVSLRKRMEAVITRLLATSGGGPALVVAKSATILRAAFRGGYHYPQRSDGRYELDPSKNKYSHPMNALEYVASKIFVARAYDPVAEHLRREKLKAPATRGMGGSRRR